MADIRLAEPRDLDEIWCLAQRAVADMQARGNPQWDDFYPTRAHYEQDLNRGELYLSAAENGRILGAVCMNTDQAPEYAPLPWRISAPALVLHRMAVDPGVMRQGIGRGFFLFGEEYAAGQGIPALHVDTYAENDRMQALFLKLGYAPVGEVHFARTLARPLPYLCFEKVL
ncbi:MAG: GNAT family N-acetyltransferase [Pseudoflavonifractor sp.]